MRFKCLITFTVFILLQNPLALRRQIGQLQEHIDLLMMESAIIQERRSLLQQQQDIKFPAVTEKKQKLDHLIDEFEDTDFLDMGESYADSVSGLSFALEGANGFQGSQPHSGSTAVGNHLCLTPPSDPHFCKVVFSDHSVVVQTKQRSRGSTSKLRTKLRDMMAAHRRLQSTAVPYEPPALFQGLVECL